MAYELHPLCVLFPRLAGVEFQALKADIAANGLRSPIVLHDGMILDGGNRYRACIEAGVEPAFETFAGGNLVSFVLSANLHRRHMTAGQQAAIVSTATDWAKAHRHGGDRRSDQAEGLPLDSVRQRAAVSGATERTQREADKLLREHPEKAREVTAGKKSLYAAVKEAAPPPKVLKAAPQVEDVEYHGPTDAEIAAAVAEADAEGHAFRVACEADDKLDALAKEVTRLRAALAAVESQRDGFMNRSNELIRRISSLKKQLELKRAA